VLVDEDRQDDDDTNAATITYQRKKPKRKPLPKDLPRETIRQQSIPYSQM